MKLGKVHTYAVVEDAEAKKDHITISVTETDTCRPGAKCIILIPMRFDDGERRFVAENGHIMDVYNKVLVLHERVWYLAHSSIMWPVKNRWYSKVSLHLCQEIASVDKLDIKVFHD